MKLVGFLAVVATGLLLLAATGDFPAWGDSESPANDNRLSKGYLTDAMVQTEVPNVVTAVLADYRGFDTMFETVVIFCAGLAIIGILSIYRTKEHEGEMPEDAVPDCAEEGDLIVRTTSRLLVPVIQLFALYVLAHGHHSPGGGFQSGVMLGASFILMAIAFGLPAALLRLSEKRAITLAAVGILIYAGIGVWAMLLGGNFLDYGVLHKILPATNETWARSHAMLGVETGVAFTVTAIMFAIYANLATRGNLKGGL
jgi:multicomponent Na+:H+ antiporter subunit B